ncbi:MAG: EAL domain-containing protein [Lachnospiraceae bacterium]|nr:EAL domain-containing protein [Lachnospiraceae bacterium]
MGPQLYFDNYTAASDVTVLAICIVIGILIMTSFVTRTRPFFLFVNMLVSLVLAVLSDMVLHDSYAHTTNGDYTVVYVMRILYHAFLLSLFLLYTFYLIDVIQLKKSRRIPVSLIAGILYISAIAADIITTVTGSGFHINADGSATSSFNIFMYGHVAFLILLTYLLLKYRDRIYRKALFGIIGTAFVSLFFLFIQEYYGHTSLTVATFLFPVIALLYILHSNPYDVKTGTINASQFPEAVNYNYLHKRNFYIISLYLVDFYAKGTPLPRELQRVVRQFPSKFFKRSVLFQIGNGDLLLMIPEKGNPDLEDKVQAFIEAFKKAYDILNFDYKLVLGKSIEEISRKNEYLSVIKSIRRNMPINSTHYVTEDDVTVFNRAEYILSELDDISKKQDLNDARVLAYCQPVFNIKTQKYDTAESLMRLELSALGTVQPSEFIPLAEDNDYIHILTKIILHKTCEAIKNMLAEGFSFKRISVNVSMTEMRNESFTKDIEEIISESGIPNGKIAIEITESRTESDLMIVKTRIEELQHTGIKFYLDDFGTGYSNMERIMTLPFDIIKFDRSLVNASCTSERSREIVGRLAAIFADLDYAVLYEGIEDTDTEQQCIGMSASYLQGFKYSQPVPIDNLSHFFTKEQ